MPKHSPGRHRRAARRRLRLLVPLVAAVLAGVPAVTVGGDAPVHRAVVRGRPPVAASAGTGAEVGRRPGSRPPGVAPAGPACTIGPKLVPTCNVLWGAAAGGFGRLP